METIDRCRQWTRVLCAGLTLATAACSGSGGQGQLSIVVTDAPLDHALVTRAVVQVDRIEIHRGDDEGSESEGGWSTLHEGTNFELDLHELRNGVTSELLQRSLNAGTYDQLRLRVVDAELELVNENVYTANEGSIHLGSWATSGLKLNFDPPLEIVSRLSESVLLDFDLSKMYKPVPANDPLAATSFNLHPAVRVVNLSTTGEIEGMVLVDDGNGTLLGAGSVSVHLMTPGETDLDLAVASTASEPDGAFAFLGLEAGTYDLLARRDALTGGTPAVTVAAGSVTQTEVLIE